MADSSQRDAFGLRMLLAFQKALLRLYPPQYRSMWSAGITEFVRDQYHAASRKHGWRGVVVTWIRVSIDTITTAVAIRLDKGPSFKAAGEGIGEMHRIEMLLDQLRQHVTYAVRQLRHSPGLTAAVTLTLGLGIGANATMFGVIDRLLLSPPEHVRDAHEVRRVFVRLYSPFFGTQRSLPIGTHPDFKDLDSAQSFVETAAYTRSRPLTFGRGLDASRANVVASTASLFPLLGVRPEAGRFFSEVEDLPGNPNVAVLGYTFWKRHFGGDNEAIGRTIKLGDLEYTVVGVAPRGFTGVELSPVDVWVNLHSRPGNWAGNRNFFLLSVVARLRPGVSATVAEAEATLLHLRGNADNPQYDPEARIVLAPLIAARGPAATAESVVARWLAGVGIVVLLIACANVANLLLERALHRRREIAVRLALGNSRVRLIKMLLTESLILALIGGVAGLLIARWGGAIVRNMLAADVDWVGSPISNRVLLFSAAVTLLTGVVMGLVPGFQSVRTDVTQALKSGGHGARAGLKTRYGLLLGQGALSVVLLVGAGLFLRSVDRLRNLDMGCDPEGVLVAGLELERADAGDSASVLARTLPLDAVERLAAMPEVEHSALTLLQPFIGRYRIQLRVQGLDSIPAQQSLGPWLNVVSAGYFDALGMRVVRGRGFAEADDSEGADPVVVVNQTMARTVWRDRDALNQCLFIGANSDNCARVIGVVTSMRDQRELTDQTLAMQYYVPVNKEPFGRPARTLLVRVRSGDTENHIAAVRRALHDLHPAIRYVTVNPLREVVDPMYRSWTLGATMFTVFGGLALSIAVIGMYSLLAFNVARRKHELGICVALGADRAHIVRMVLGQAMALVAGGLAIGASVSLAAGGAIEPLLFQVSARDPLVLVAVIGTLALAGLAAALIPARRATSVDPMETMRVE